MDRPYALGDLVRFKLTTGQFADGIIVHKIVEKRQPTIYLVEAADRRRAFRFEAELSLVVEAEARQAAGVAEGFEPILAAPVFASRGADD
ncbi:hypothetical protein OJF2_13100 [Aquisphaera giovannonii]|uniref:Uncharacterized protein n=1 Tax=Aquisphaera giovannonii TaxID=406548 RepID=A0A5B9VWJ8_9BACT|nr:hypothetical protein [Aquisphaera giovannonii]QEH32826.1 hypothetical protein OJF2_13100 [Aquisphaera giovannonii]